MREELSFENLVASVAQIQELTSGRAKNAVNQLLTIRNWMIGYYIVEFEMNGKNRADYGTHLLKELEKSINIKGMNQMLFYNCRTFYTRYPQIFSTVSKKLGSLSKSLSLPDKISFVETELEASEKLSTASKKFLAQNMICLSETIEEGATNMSNDNKRLPTVTEQYEQLLRQVGDTLQKGRSRLATVVQNTTVLTYWEIGQHIIEYEQNGNERAEYGSNVLNSLSKDLTDRYGAGFSRSNVFYMRKLYLTYPKVQTLSELLSWSHYVELLKIEDPLERSFYEKECEAEHWGIRELKRQMKSMLFHRLALSKEKDEVMRLAQEGQIIEKPEDILKEPYVFEFAGLPALSVYNEGDLEDALIANFGQFFLEMGKGFTFVGRQQKFTISGRTYSVDLVFYHRILKCFVLVDLKSGEVQHEDIGQMNFYLNYYREEMNTEGDGEPIGLVLGANHDKLVMHYALANISNQLFVSRYQLYLPDREMLEAELNRFLGDRDETDK